MQVPQATGRLISRISFLFSPLRWVGTPYGAQDRETTGTRGASDTTLTGRSGGEPIIELTYSNHWPYGSAVAC